MLFWRSNSQGYTTKLSEAERYELTEAMKIVSNKERLDTAYPVDYIDGLAERTVDMQKINGKKKLTVIDRNKNVKKTPQIEICICGERSSEECLEKCVKLETTKEDF
jgi:hypothetical protein